MSMQPSIARRRSGRAHRALSIALLVVAAAVFVLHAGFLWQRLADRSIAQPGVIARWVIAALLALVALALGRRRSRHGWLVFWLIAALLHVGGLAIVSESVVAAAPLLLLFVAAVSGASFDVTRLATVPNSTRPLTGYAAYASDRAPPWR